MSQRGATTALWMSTIAFATCFAAWMIYGVLITHLVNNQQFGFSQTQVGWLLGIPVLSGSLARLPVGMLTDKYGGRNVTALLMILAAIPLFLVSQANGFTSFFGLGFGLCGASFASGVPFLATWYPHNRLGTALGIFGAGNAGAAMTSICGPLLLQQLTDGGQNAEGWRVFPRLYAFILVMVAILFWILVRTNPDHHPKAQSISVRLRPLARMRVWRFGLYYFLVFGGFVGLSQWLIPYYVNVYEVSVVSAGMLAAAFSLPAGVIRALGGWMSDHWGARTIMYWILGTILVCGIVMAVPRMKIQASGQGVIAKEPGTVMAISARSLRVNELSYPLLPSPSDKEHSGDSASLISVSRWQEATVAVGETVKRGQLVARGITQIYYDANIVLFTILLMTVGIAMGIGSAAVYKHIPVYFPDSVGTTGGIVGVLGGLGGLACPVIFGILLSQVGVWSSCFVFIALLALVCLVWMHRVIQRMQQERDPGFAQTFEKASAKETGE